MINPLLREALRIEHVKPRLLGHWGTTPGLNFIYAHLNRVIVDRDVDMIYVTGPGHGGPGLVANAYLEGTYAETYPAIREDTDGLRALFRQFSFPGGIPSHVAPETPGSIHEGGELGYALAHAYGAALDNPDLVVACVIGDGEAETGPLAASWHSTKLFNAARDGAVLPILHLNGYKIANPTVLARIPEDDLDMMLRGYGWDPVLVSGDDPADVHQQMAAALDDCVARIREIQAAARTGEDCTQWAGQLDGEGYTPTDARYCINSVSLNESLTFDMDAASGMSLTSGTITLGAATTQTFTNGTSDTATFSGVIAGSGAFTKAGAGALGLSATNTYSGATTVSAGTLTVSGGDAISSNSSVAVAGGATLALSTNETFGNLSGAGTITLGSNTLTSILTADTTFSGGISGTGGLSVSQSGAPTFALTLSGSNTYTGNTIAVNFGWLKLNGDASVSSSSQLSRISAMYSPPSRGARADIPCEG